MQQLNATVYTLPGCEACAAMCSLLKQRGIHLIQINLEDDPLAVLALHKLILKGQEIFAPIAVVSGDGVYVLDSDKKNLLKVKLGNLDG